VRAHSARRARTPPGYFFERDELLDLRERDELPDFERDELPDFERDELPDFERPVFPLAELRERDLLPVLPLLLVLRVLRFGAARFFRFLVSPASLRALFTVRAAISLARLGLLPRLRADCLIFSYWRLRFGFFTPRGGIFSPPGVGWLATP
jgi:hypothetical protein